jgi:hypothetical protein
MRRSSKPLPKDPNQLAHEIVKMSIEEPPDSIKEYLARIGRNGGLKGGKERARKLSPQRRTEIAKRAAMKRWQK